MNTTGTLALYSLGFFIIILLVRSWMKRRNEKKYWAKIHEKMHVDAELYDEDDEEETSSSSGYEYYEETNYKRRDKPTNSGQQFEESHRLTSCEVCGDKVSIEASSCPHCGHPTENALHEVTAETDHVVNRTKSRSESTRDENIRLIETVGRFSIGDKHYCYDCDSVSVHLEEKYLGETFVFFEVLNFFIPWKWAAAVTVFKFWDKKYQTVCTNCYPDFYDDWKLFKRKKRKQKLRALLVFMMMIFALYLYVKN